MVPARFELHESLPVTPQGKLDRAALIARQSAKPAQPPQIATSGNELENKLARLWHAMLPAAAASPPDATFRSLGGDSLLAIKLILEVENIAGIQFDVSSFLLQPTLKGLIALVQNRLAGESPRFVAMRRTGSRPPPPPSCLGCEGSSRPARYAWPDIRGEACWRLKPRDRSWLRRENHHSLRCWIPCRRSVRWV